MTSKIHAEMVHNRADTANQTAWYRLWPTLMDNEGNRPWSILRGPFQDTVDAECAAEEEARAVGAELVWDN